MAVVELSDCTVEAVARRKVDRVAYEDRLLSPAALTSGDELHEASRESLETQDVGGRDGDPSAGIARLDVPAEADRDVVVAL